jgi:hypothetical protein
MGYTHSWGWEETIPNYEQFPLWSADVEHLYDCYNENPPPDPYRKEPWSLFNPPFLGAWETTICGPHGDYYPIFRPEIVSFNGSRLTDNHCEAFEIRARDLEHRGFFSCKTWGNPYDLLVTAALVRFEYYFPQIAIHCGGGVEGLDDAVRLCQIAFGSARNPLRDASYCNFVDRTFGKRSA